MKYITAFNELKRRYKSNYKLGVPLYLVNQYTVTSTSDLIIQYCTNTPSNEYYFLGLMYTEVKYMTIICLGTLRELIQNYLNDAKRR